MSAPLKPWERPGVNYQNTTHYPVNTMSAVPGSQDRLTATMGIPPSANPSMTSPPPVPPRPSQQPTFNSRLGGPSIGYGGYGGYSSYGGYGNYSSPFGYGGYGNLYSSPYSNFSSNRMGDVRSGFAQHAEESSRPAFESIESIVYAVNSVGMMLDSTFQAVYNSFRAVIGVADNFTRLKSQLIQVFSALAFIRTLRYFFRKLLEILRLRPKGEADKLWKLASAEAAKLSQAGGSGKSSWPILLFFGIIMGGPYLIWKLISAFSSESAQASWSSGEDDHFVARANYSFQGQNSEELSFSAGQNIIVAPKELQPQVRGWLLACVDGQKTGMIPANYVSILGKKSGTKHSTETPNQPSSVSTDRSTLGPESQLQQVFDSTQSQVSNLNESQLDSAFCEDTKTGLLKDDSSKSAADILNDVDK
uniref:Peroxisomal membrane protein PEX13 n=1 Tax=Biomphalaria glabrata TaxID=6526 RepID=A0A2C9JPI2_BIOGL